MVSEQELMDAAVRGIILSILLSFLIILACTLNIIVSIYALISLIGIVSGVFMVIWAKNWEFGTYCSMNSIMIIGLSVDYIIHLSTTYTESKHHGRKERTKETLTVMGVSVLGGGFTTLGACSFLFGGKLKVFEVAASLICSTIGFSLAWALFFFPAINYVMGSSG